MAATHVAATHVPTIAGGTIRLACVRYPWAAPQRAHCPHACAVFGRCIAGRGLGGNMGYFLVIIVMGQLGWITAAASVVVSIVYRVN
jgi:hypothetical protein